MAKYIAKRVALALVTLVIVSMLTFFLMFLVPGGPFLSEKSPSPAVLAAMEEKYGLDKPVIVQYKNYMLNLLQGELGPPRSSVPGSRFRRASAASRWLLPSSWAWCWAVWRRSTAASGSTTSLLLLPPAASRCRALLYVPYYCIYSA